ncbi:MAG: hypothetical protein VB141_11225 [Burkholderia gladioli]
MTNRQPHPMPISPGADGRQSVREARLAAARAWAQFTESHPQDTCGHACATLLHPEAILRDGALLVRPLSSYRQGDHVIYRRSRLRGRLCTLRAAFFVAIRPAMWKSIARDPHVWHYTRKYFARDRYIAVGCL